MKFLEQLKKVQELKLDVLDIEVADECECVFDFKYTDDEFEKLCGVVKQAYLKDEEMTINALVNTVNDFLKRKEYTIKEIEEMSYWDLINKASYYL